MLNLAGATASVDYYEADFDCWCVGGGGGREPHLCLHTSVDHYEADNRR